MLYKLLYLFTGKLKWYWKSQQFSYIVFYSGILERGLKSLIEEDEARFEKLKAGIEINFFKPFLKRQFYHLGKAIGLKKIFDANGQLYPIVKEVMRIYKDDQRIKFLDDIFTLKTKKKWNCLSDMPFSDAMLFYNEKDEIVGAIYIGFRTRKIADGNLSRFSNIGWQIFTLLEPCFYPSTRIEKAP